MAGNGDINTNMPIVDIAISEVKALLHKAIFSCNANLGEKDIIARLLWKLLCDRPCN